VFIVCVELCVECIRIMCCVQDVVFNSYLSSCVPLSSWSFPYQSIDNIILGYLTNTGIKFMLIIENVQLNEDGISFDTAPSSFHQLLYRESELKTMFVSQSFSACCVD
jgi:hypothetical protein